MRLAEGGSCGLSVLITGSVEPQWTASRGRKMHTATFTDYNNNNNKKTEHALSHEGIPTDHTAGIKQLQEATPVRSALGKGPAQGHSQVINGEDRRAGLRLRRCVLGLA